MRCPVGFHRFQGIRARRFTLSTAGLYDLYTMYGQAVDKKALLPGLRNYPQVPPQPEGPLYWGFQVHKSLQNQLDNEFLHEIWAYHHHHALDLYPDLEARPAPIRPQRDLWTVASADEATAALRPTICFTPPASSGNVHQAEDPELPYSTEVGWAAPKSATWIPTAQGRLHRRGNQEQSASSNLEQGIHPDVEIRRSPMLHVEPAKKTPGNIPGVFGSTWNRLLSETQRHHHVARLLAAGFTHQR